METIIKQFYELSLDELYQILKLRVDVFVVEQTCPYPEVDDQDQQAIHVLIKRDGILVAYARVLPINELRAYVAIGRVIAKERGQGLGQAVMKEAILVSQEQLKADKIYLEAQAYAQPFYEKLGFQQMGQEFIEDGIPHVPMLLSI